MSKSLGRNVLPLEEVRLKSESCFTASELQSKNYPPVKYIVPGYIPEGLCILAGKPKQGKSWLCLETALAVASGQNVFGDVQCEVGDVLYLALEDSGRRLQQRLEKLQPKDSWPERLTFELASKPLDEDGLKPLEEWVRHANNPRLIIIDVFAKVRGQAVRGDSLYAADYKAAMGLHDLANNHRIAIVIVHHLRKMKSDDPFEMISGSTGLTGACDTILVMDRASEGVVLYGVGRDIEGYEKAVVFDTDACRWKVRGDASDVRRSEQRNKILLALKESADPMNPQEIAAEAGMKQVNVRQMLSRMVKSGEVVKEERGLYKRPP